MAIDIFPLWHASLRHPAGNTPLPEGQHCMNMYKMHFFSGMLHFFLPAAGFFSRSLLPARRGGAPVQHGVSVDPSQAPRRVLGAFKVSKSGK